MNKIKHNYKCEHCGKPATITLEDNWIIYNITNNGEFCNRSEFDGNNNYFYCDECAKNEGLL